MKFLIGTLISIWVIVNSITKRKKRRLFETILRIVIGIIATILFFGQFITKLG